VTERTTLKTPLQYSLHLIIAKSLVHRRTQVPPEASLFSCAPESCWSIMDTTSTLLTCLLIIIGVTMLGRAMQIYQGDECLARCAVARQYTPVCGTDYITYTNPSSLLCWKKCRDPNLSVAHFSTCVDWITGNVKL
ncbi:hypothetical protein OTU49_000557, partial [Cherax quadricarinatus]